MAVVTVANKIDLTISQSYSKGYGRVARAIEL